MTTPKTATDHLDSAAGDVSDADWELTRAAATLGRDDPVARELRAICGNLVAIEKRLMKLAKELKTPALETTT